MTTDESGQSVVLTGRLFAILGRIEGAIFSSDGNGIGEELGKAVARALPTTYFDREVEIIVRWREADAS